MKFTSGYIVPKPIRYVPGQNSQREVLLKLLERKHASQEWCSTHELARELHMTEASVGSRLRDLRAEGYVITRKSFKTKAGTVFKYRME